TSVFTILGKPFEPYLALLNIPQAADAAQLMVVGFTDMFLPVILANGLITSELTLFVVATISVNKLFFLLEVVGLYLGSKLILTFFTLIHISKARDGASLMVVRFIDMFLPCILANRINTSEITFFFVGTVSGTQLIFLAEVGGLLLGSKIPVNFFDLVMIFLLRTIIALPIVAGIGHLIF